MSNGLPPDEPKEVPRENELYFSAFIATDDTGKEHLDVYVSNTRNAIAAKYLAKRSKEKRLARVVQDLVRSNIDDLTEKSGKIERPPGYRLVSLLAFLCREKTVERVIEPMHAEYFSEYASALSKGEKWKAQYIKCQMHFYLIYAVISKNVLGVIGSCLSGVFKANSDD